MSSSSIEFVGVQMTNESVELENRNKIPTETIFGNCLTFNYEASSSQLTSCVKNEPDNGSYQSNVYEVSERNFGTTIKEEFHILDELREFSKCIYYESRNETSTKYALVDHSDYTLKCKVKEECENLPVFVSCEVSEECKDFALKCEVEEAIISTDLGSNLTDAFVQDIGSNNNLYKSLECADTFAEKVKIKEDSSDFPKCKACGKSFSSKGSLHRHRRTQHSQIKPYKCSKCDRSFARKDNLEYHRAQHFKVKSHQCPICNKSFLKEDQLSRHQDAVLEGLGPHRCINCNESFCHKSNLSEHQISVHLMTKPHQCSKCDKCFAYLSGLKFHETARHSGKIKVHNCPDCGNSYYKKVHLAKHRKLHLLKTEYKCNECTKTYSREDSLRRHQIATHSKIRPFKCQDCDANYANRDVLRAHRMRVHLHTTPSYKCLDCDKKYTSLRNLKDHQMFKHTKVKSHQCLDCNKCYTNEKSLRCHQEAVHDKLKPYRCTECEKSFYRKSYLNVHKFTQHLKNKPVT